VQTHFGDSIEESTTSRTSSMKGANSGTNRSDLDKNNIIKPTFETLMEEGHKAFEAYRANLKELFLLCCEVTRRGTVLKDTTSIIFHKAELIPKVWPGPSPSHDGIQCMIDSVLKRQAKSADKLLCRLIEKRDGEKLDTTSVKPSSCVVSFTQINPQTSGALADGATMPNQPSR
jgi:hypothetical protein